MKAPIVENSSSDSFSMTRAGVDSATISFFPEPEQRPGDGPHQRPFLNGFGTGGTLNSMPLSTRRASGGTDVGGAGGGWVRPPPAGGARPAAAPPRGLTKKCGKRGVASGVSGGGSNP